MKILVTGKGGQLASELEQTVPPQYELVVLDASELDISNKTLVEDAINKVRPDIIVNAAAYTAVDKAETDKDTAYAVNEQGSENLALACKNYGAQLIHVSTDFVFDGTKTTPYQTDDTPNPINVYGDSKLQGDLRINQILAADATIIRTAWVYSAHGNNFVKTMLRLMTDKEQLDVVYDQVGTPTWAKGLAQMIWTLVEKNTNAPQCSQSGIAERDVRNNLSEASTKILHWTDAGVASWYDFAIAIQDLGIEKGMLDKKIPIRPIPASSYPTPAKRPSFSVIDKTNAEAATGIETTHWREQLSLMMDELKLL